jgi:hypothetical protein
MTKQFATLWTIATQPNAAGQFLARTHVTGVYECGQIVLNVTDFIKRYCSSADLDIEVLAEMPKDGWPIYTVTDDSTGASCQVLYSADPQAKYKIEVTLKNRRDRNLFSNLFCEGKA